MGRRFPRFAAPMHPIFVHFTIGLAGSSVAFDVLALVTRAASLRAAAWWTLAGAVVVTPATLVSGLTSRRRLPVQEGEARTFLRAHMALGPTWFGLLIALAVWRAALWQSGRSPGALYLGAAAAMALVMTVQGYLGGELVYRHGAEVEGRYRELPGRPPDAPLPPRPAP